MSIQRFESGGLVDEQYEFMEILPDHDYLMQLDVKGENLELRVWRDDEPKPVDASVIMADTSYRQGWVGLAYISDELGAYGIYRYVWVSDDPPDIAVRLLRGDCDDDGRMCVLSWRYGTRRRSC